MEEKKYVADTTLECYTDNVQNWVLGQLSSIPMIDYVYDEENRILEIIESVK